MRPPLPPTLCLERGVSVPAPRDSRSPRPPLAVHSGSELRADLNSQYRDQRKEAIKRVIASMTVGKDVSGPLLSLSSAPPHSTST